MPPIYDKLFPSAVAGIMKGDITGGVGPMREAMAEIPGGKGATLEGMIKHHISTLGKDKCAAEKKNGTKAGNVIVPSTSESGSPWLTIWLPSRAVTPLAQPRGDIHLHDASQSHEGHGDEGRCIRRL